MTSVLIFSGPVFFLLVWTALSTWKAGRRGSGEEKAHASAWRRRSKTKPANSNREASVMILGDAENRAGCCVKRVSSSSLRAVTTRSLGEGAQVRVEWGDDVFIGNVSVERPEPPGFQIEVSLLATTYGGSGLFARLMRAVHP